ncbi:MAG: HAD-IIA family hydrolase [Acidimicrobiia bacterium]
MTGTIVCDLDGVVYLGDQEVPGAGVALHRLHAAGFRLLFATNNSSRTRAEGAAKIARVTGYHTDRDQFVSSATAAGAMLAGTSVPALVVGGAGVIEALTDAGITITEDPLEAGVVVVGLDMALTYEKLAHATMAVRNGARLVATNLDATYPTPTGLLPGAGSIVAALETSTGVRAESAGKPFPPMRAILNAMANSGPVWMVGDRADTDLAMADLEGWTSVLVLTGVAEGPEGIDPAPHVVLHSLADLPAHLGL